MRLLGVVVFAALAIGGCSATPEEKRKAEAEFYRDIPAGSDAQSQPIWDPRQTYGGGGFE